MKGGMSAQLASSSPDIGALESPVLPRHDPQHEARTVAAIARAIRDIPFYASRGYVAPAPGMPLREALARLPLLTKKDVRSTLPKQWVPAGRDTKAEIASGALELVETSGSTGERLRILWDEGWWPRQETRAMRTHERIAAAMDGAQGPYRETILTSPECGVGVCHYGDVPYEERKDETHLWISQRPDPLYWSDAEQTRMLDELGMHGTVGMESDPFYLSVLSRYARAHGRKLDVKSFVQLTYAFTSRPFLRSIREGFGGEVVQLYGASEVGVLFMEGTDGRLHHSPFTTHVELLPARVPTPGAKDVALVVVTTLDRSAMPLLRFLVGDLVQVDREGPRTWTSVAPLVSVEGRVDDAVVRPDGALVTAGALDRAIGAPDGLTAWQIHQAAPGSVSVDVVAEGDAARAAEEVRARVLPLCTGLEVTARAVTAIAVEASGKLRVSKRDFPLDLAATFEGV
jgi:phenylacetate-coenzyme A ligase PaaK-like adenylate-forming protein